MNFVASTPTKIFGFEQFAIAVGDWALEERVKSALFVQTMIFASSVLLCMKMVPLKDVAQWLIGILFSKCCLNLMKNN